MRSSCSHKEIVCRKKQLTTISLATLQTLSTGDDCKQHFFIRYDNAMHAASQLRVTFVTNKTANPSLVRVANNYYRRLRRRTTLRHAEMPRYATFITLFYLRTYINIWHMCMLRNRIFAVNFFQILTLSVIISVAAAASFHRVRHADVLPAIFQLTTYRIISGRWK